MTGVMGGSNLHIPKVTSHVIETVGNHFSLGKRRPIMVVNLDGLLGIGVPLTNLAERSTLFFCVHAHNGIASTFVAVHKCLNVLKLFVALRMISSRFGA